MGAKPLANLTIDHALGIAALRISADHLAPEPDRDSVAQVLGHLPLARKAIEDQVAASRRRLSGAGPQPRKTRTGGSRDGARAILGLRHDGDALTSANPTGCSDLEPARPTNQTGFFSRKDETRSRNLRDEKIRSGS